MKLVFHRFIDRNKKNKKNQTTSLAKREKSLGIGGFVNSRPLGDVNYDPGNFRNPQLRNDFHSRITVGGNTKVVQRVQQIPVKISDWQDDAKQSENLALRSEPLIGRVYWHLAIANNEEAPTFISRENGALITPSRTE